MLGKSIQLLSNEPIQIATSVLAGPAGSPTFNTGGPYVSPIFTTDGYSGFVLVVHLAATPTGTTPTLVWEIDSSADGNSFTRVGAALAAMSPTVLDQVTLYVAGSTQGAIAGPYFRAVATPAGANALFQRVYADIIAQGL